MIRVPAPRLSVPFSSAPHCAPISHSIRTILSLRSVVDPQEWGKYWGGMGMRKKFGRYSFEKGLSCLHVTQKEGGAKTKQK